MKLLSLHRTCDEILDSREALQRESNARYCQLLDRLEVETRRSAHRWAGLIRVTRLLMDTRIRHTADLAAAAAREADLQRRVLDLEEEDHSRQAVLEARRRRAAESVLEGVVQGPEWESSLARAQVAQALLALPLASYDVVVDYDVVDGMYLVDGARLYRSSQYKVLTSRYGLAQEELDAITADARRRWALAEEA